SLDPIETEKPGIWLRGCQKLRGAELYPLHQDPSKWLSCENDAYELTWSRDGPNSHYLEGLSDLEVAWLRRSMGFCPWARCQLGDQEGSPGPGRCPVGGACWPRTQGGQTTFGSCCFGEDG
ncbi:unnamed protein product, partial [Heterosigma akashiwo]